MAEVAEAQRISISAAKSRIRRGLAVLRRTLGPTALVGLLVARADAYSESLKALSTVLAASASTLALGGLSWQNAAALDRRSSG